MFKQLVEDAITAALSKDNTVNEISESAEVLSEAISVNDHVEHHIKTIDHVASKNADKSGYHALHTSEHDLDRVQHAHHQLAKLHDAHATIHRANGNHEGADAHEEAADTHRAHAKVSSRSYGRRISHKNLESHEEYDHSSSWANSDSREAFKNHPIK